MEKKITRLAVFDFDGTLVDTPLPTDKTKALYKQKTGEAWEHKGWWGRKETLDQDIFDMPVIESVIADYEKEKAKTNTLVVMITGRIKRLSGKVESILDSKGLEFDGYYYNMGGSTFDNKINTMESLLKQYPDIKKIHLFDDRDEHIPLFQDWGDNLVSSNQLNDFEITHVKK